MASAGAALLFIGLGLAPQPNPVIYGIFQALFAASALIFVSSAVSSVKDNALLGSLMFAGALSIVGIAVINIVREGQAAGLLQTSSFAGGAAAIMIAFYGAVKGETGARLILPGALLAIAAPFIGPAVGPVLGGVATEVVFAAGVLSAALLGGLNAVVANLGAVNMRLPRKSGDTSRSGVQNGAALASNHGHFPGPAPARATHRQDRSLSENQLAQVLDYTGVGVWDWSTRGARQTESFCQIMGAGCEGDFTPEAMLEFIKSEHQPGFKTDVLGANGEDGSFNLLVGLVTGKTVRMRGARAVDANGDLERVIVFVEDTNEALGSTLASADGDRNAHLLQNAAASLAGTAAMGAGRSAPLSVSPSEVAAALNSGELSAGFQPIVSLRDGSTVGFEALVRWPSREHDGRTPPPADDIIRAAELAGEGDAIARLMVSAAVQKIADEREKKEFAKAKPFASVNVSVGQSSALGFVEAVRNAIESKKLPAKALVLELTEVEKIEDTAAVAATFAALKEAGAALAFDDFGAGLSSLSTLHKYDFDYLKIDRSFIDRLRDESGADKTVAALARLGREFGMTVIAEGVEAKKTADIARVAGCQLGQGYLYGEAVIGAALVNETSGADDVARATEADVEQSTEEHASPSDTGGSASVDASSGAQDSDDNLVEGSAHSATDGEQSPASIDNKGSDLEIDRAAEIGENEKSDEKNDLKGDLDIADSDMENAPKRTDGEGMIGREPKRGLFGARRGR